MPIQILPTNIYLATLAESERIQRSATREPLPQRRAPYLDTDIRVTISEAARRALADAEARDRLVLDGLIPLRLKMFK